MAIERFGPYDLLRLIGRGGMGEVFEAYDTEQERTVALKRLVPHLAHDQEFQGRFRRESKLAARLRNPHVVPIHRFGEIDGQLFIDMRLVEGCDLDQLMAHEGRLDPARAVAIIEQVAWALDAAHHAGLVHRDIKPSNVLLDDAAEAHEFVYLADFGITRAVGGASLTLTSTNAIVGSLDYMAPEQFEGLASPLVDVYSLGCVLFHCLTGSKPFPADGLPAMMRAHLLQPPPRPSGIDADLGPFDEVIARALAKEPEERYASAGALAEAARAVHAPAADSVELSEVPTLVAPGSPDGVTEPVLRLGTGSPPAAAAPDSAAPPGAILSHPSRWRTRRTLLVAAAVAALVLVLAGVGTTLLSARSAASSTPVAAAASKPTPIAPPPPTDVVGLVGVLRGDPAIAGPDGPQLESALQQVASTSGEIRRQSSLAVLQLATGGQLVGEYAHAASVAVTPYTQLNTPTDMIQDLTPDPAAAGPNAHYVLNCMHDLLEGSVDDQKSEASEILEKLPNWSANGGVRPDVSAATQQIATKELGS